MELGVEIFAGCTIDGVSGLLVANLFSNIGVFIEGVALPCVGTIRMDAGLERASAFASIGCRS